MRSRGSPDSSPSMTVREWQVAIQVRNGPTSRVEGSSTTPQNLPDTILGLGYKTYRNISSSISTFNIMNCMLKIYNAWNIFHTKLFHKWWKFIKTVACICCWLKKKPKLHANSPAWKFFKLHYFQVSPPHIHLSPFKNINKKYDGTYPRFFMGSTPSMSKPSSVSVPVYNVTFNHTKLFIFQIDIYNIKYKICDIEWK